MSHELIVLGRLTRPQGIKGEIRVEYGADSPLLLEKPLFLRAGHSQPVPVRIVSRRFWNGQLIIRLEGVDDRSAAEMLRGRELLIREADLPDTEPDEPYLRDIVGLPVVLEETGETVGVLEDVFFPAGQEIWSIRTEEGHEILFPAVPEFVTDIDLDADVIHIMPPAGLLELYLSAASEAGGKPDPKTDRKPGERARHAAASPRKKAASPSGDGSPHNSPEN